MKRFHVKHSMKKALAYALAAAIVIPGAVVSGSIQASAESLPEPARFYDMERGFRGETDAQGAVIAKNELKQAKFGGMIGFIEDVYPEGHQYAKKKYFSPVDGRLTGKYQEVSTVLVQGSWKSANTTNTDSKYHKGYEQASIRSGEKKQYLPDISTTDGSFLQFNPGYNQPTTAYDKEKGMVFWLDNTLEVKSYPTYASTVDYENGKINTDMSVIVKDTKGQYQEAEFLNSAAEFDNPFAGGSATGLTFSAWIKNTQPYKEPVVYGMLGDLNGDKKIQTADALIVLKHVAGVEVLGESALGFADVDGNEKVQTADALMILKKVAGLPVEFTGTASGGAESVTIYEDSEFFHVEKRTLEGNDEKKITGRQYLYFTGNGVTYVGNYKDSETVCTWKLPESSIKDETVNLLHGMNGSKWSYVSYTFDGTDFHMYLNGKTVPLERTAGSKYNSSEIMSLVADSEAKTYLGGRGGGMEGNFNENAIATSAHYYMDDVAVYTEKFTDTQAEQAYSEAVAAMTAEQTKEWKKLKTYSFDGATLAANEMKAINIISNFDSGKLPAMNQEGKVGKGIKLLGTAQKSAGGVELENPFSKSKTEEELTGVTISYWLKSVANARGVVTDGVVLSFIDGEHECYHEKVGDNYLGQESIARSQLYLKQGFEGVFNEGTTKGIGSNSLKNTFTYKPYPYGNPTTIDEWKKQFEVYGKEGKNDLSYFRDAGLLRNSLAKDWNFITVTFNNKGFVMYLNGEEVKNKCVDYTGARFCDYYGGRVEESRPEMTRKATNNGGARSMMDFLTADDTRVYIGFAFEDGSSSNVETSSECYLDELSFYDKDMTAEEVKALYNSVK